MNGLNFRPIFHFSGFISLFLLSIIVHGKDRMNIEFPESPTGIHPPTAALTRILQFNAVENPLTGQPYSEAFILGIGGGLDIGCILYQFKHLPHPLLMMGFRNQWNNAREFLNKVADRLHLSVSFIEYEAANQAQAGLQDFLDKGKQPIVWVDKTFLQYRMIPENLKGFLDYQVTVYTRDGQLWKLYLDDLSSKPMEIREKDFTTARGNLSQNNFLMMVVDDVGKPGVRELRENILTGLHDCASQLTRPVTVIGNCNLKTWSQKLVDHKDRQGWPQVFKDQKGLYPVLRTIYESIKLDGTEGFALRKLYSDFLHEAASHLGNPEMNAIAGQYLQLANRWANLAESALSSDVPIFKEVKILLNDQYRAYKKGDLSSMQKFHQELDKLGNKIETDFPLDAKKTNEFYENLASQIRLLSELEFSAARRLQDIVYD